jgi:membrane protease YdiL (CAAX protease family)
MALAILFLTFLAFKSSVVLHAILVMTLPDTWHEGLIDYREALGRRSIESVFFGTLYAPFMEEFFFRALIAFAFGALGGRWFVRTIYFVVSATLFAQFHVAYGVAAWILLFYVGLLAAVIYLLVRNIWFVVMAHALSNLFDMIWVWRLSQS